MLDHAGCQLLGHLGRDVDRKELAWSEPRDEREGAQQCLAFQFEPEPDRMSEAEHLLRIAVAGRKTRQRLDSDAVAVQQVEDRLQHHARGIAVEQHRYP